MQIDANEMDRMARESQRKRGRPQKLAGQRLYSVYALIADGAFRYIGITQQALSRRLSQHFQDTNRNYRREHKTNWLRKCSSNGISVSIKLLRRGLNLASAQRIEKQIIKRLRPQLVNVHEGGSSGYNGLPNDAKIRHAKNTKDGLRRAGINFKALSKKMVEAKARNRHARYDAGLEEMMADAAAIHKTSMARLRQRRHREKVSQLNP